MSASRCCAAPRDYAKVKQALAAAGYNGEKIVVIAPTDVNELGNLTRIGAEQLRRAGMNVDLQEMDFGSVVRRRSNQSPPDKGGWNMFCTLIDRSLPNVHPYGTSGDPRRRQGGHQRLGQQPADRGIARRLARRGGFRRAEADLRRIAEAAVAGRAVHPAGRILAGERLSKHSDRCDAGLLRHLLRGAASLSHR